ncbi:MAG: hypothetical protein ACPK7O_05355 [Methanobacterium sp.]
MKFKIILLLSIFVLLSFSSVAYADVIDPSMKNVKIYYQVSNIQEYPDYVFFIHGNPSPSLEIINSSKFSFYKLSTVSIYAINKKNFNENDLKNMDDSEIENFFKNNLNIIKSDIELQGASKSVEMSNPLDEMIITLNIDSINNKSMDIKKSKVTYRYNDGSMQEETYKDQNSTPEPTKKDTWSNNLFYTAIPFVAFVALVIIVRFRFMKKK